MRDAGAPGRAYRPWQQRARRLWACAAMALATATGCQNDVQRALAAADEASFRGAPHQAEQILRRLERRLASAEQTLARTGARQAPGPGTPAYPAYMERRTLHAQVLERLAQLNALQLGRAEQAIHDWTALAKIEQAGPKAGRALRQVASLLRHELGQPAESVPVLRQAAELLGTGDEAAEACRTLVATYVELANYDAACNEARAMLAAWPDGPIAADARLRLGQAQFLAQRYEAAAATFLRLVDERPNRMLTAMALVEAGHAYQELGEAARALTYYYAAVQDHPNPLLVQDKIARVRARIYQLEANRTILQAKDPSRHVASATRRP